MVASASERVRGWRVPVGPGDLRSFAFDEGGQGLDDTVGEPVFNYEEYHPFGTTSWWATNGSTDVSAKRYRYTGKEKDEETGLAYHGARYYAAWLGRWERTDPIGLGGGVNRWAYCRGNPINRSDTTGNADSAMDRMMMRDEKDYLSGEMSAEELHQRQLARSAGTGVGAVAATGGVVAVESGAVGALWSALGVVGSGMNAMSTGFAVSTPAMMSLESSTIAGGLSLLGRAAGVARGVGALAGATRAVGEFWSGIKGPAAEMRVGSLVLPFQGETRAGVSSIESIKSVLSGVLSRASKSERLQVPESAGLVDDTVSMLGVSVGDLRISVVPDALLRASKDTIHPAMYGPPKIDPDSVYTLNDLLDVRLASSFAKNDEAIVYALSHELYELNALAKVIEAEGGTISGRRLGELTRGTGMADDGTKNLHRDAVDVSDYFVEVMRGVRD